jgi:hypothetical protein
MMRLLLPFDELWALGSYYLPSLACCTLVALAALISGVLISKWHRTSKHVARKISYLVAGVALVIWLVYFATTLRSAYAITSLDTEDDRRAERVYMTIFDIDLKDAIKIAVDQGVSGNVRFYASCRIADLVASNSDYPKLELLKSITNAPPFETGFFGTNRLTADVFRPNYQEGPFTVAGVIAKRLSMLNHDHRDERETHSW